MSRVSLINNIWTNMAALLIGQNHRTEHKENADHDSEAPAPSFRSQLAALTSRLILGVARREELGLGQRGGSGCRRREQGGATGVPKTTVTAP